MDVHVSDRLKIGGRDHVDFTLHFVPDVFAVFVSNQSDCWRGQCDDPEIYSFQMLHSYRLLIEI
jgi:hypothetical protein